jgi:hypothetical protein
VGAEFKVKLTENIFRVSNNEYLTRSIEETIITACALNIKNNSQT